MEVITCTVLAMTLAATPSSMLHWLRSVGGAVESGGGAADSGSGRGTSTSTALLWWNRLDRLRVDMSRAVFWVCQLPPSGRVLT